MVRRSTNDLLPKEFAVPRTGDWPYCRVAGPRFAHAAAKFARELDKRKGDKSVREIGRVADVDPNVITRILRGESWANGLQIFKLTTALELDIFSPASLVAYDVEQLVEDFAAFVERADLVNRSSEFSPKPPPGKAMLRLKADIYVPESHTIIEVIQSEQNVRASEWRVENAVRGFELVRRLPGDRQLNFAVLLARAPDSGMADALQSQKVHAIYPEGDGFTDTLDGLLVQMIRERRDGGKPAD